jgi:uncharacterized protein YkwD
MCLIVALLWCGSCLDEGLANDKAEMLRLHNSVRSSPLERSEVLDGVAQQYAEHLLATGGVGHYVGSSPVDRIRRAGYVWSTWAENVAWASADARHSFNVWRSSGGHNANILGSFREVGLGQAGHYWVAVYGTPAGATAAAVTQTVLTGCPGGVCPVQRPRRPFGWIRR